MNESWQIIGHPYLACQFATIIHGNPFQYRFNQQLNMWLNVRDSDDSSEEATMPTRKQNPSTLTLIMTCSADEIILLKAALK